MDRIKLEWLLILILLLLNLFLLAAIWPEQAAAEQERAEVREAVAALLRERGIAPEASVELVQSCPVSCTLARSMEEERRFALRLLGGEVRGEDLGGSIMSYGSSGGRLVMRGTGELRLLLSEHGAIGPEDVERYFSTAGVVLYPIAADRERDGGIQRYVCGWNGYPIFNATLTFRFAGGRLEEASGTLPFSAGQEKGERAGMDSVTALLHFLDLAKREGIICSRLEELRPGYMMSVTVSGESALLPVWHIVTDTVELYLDAETGDDAGARSM